MSQAEDPSSAATTTNPKPDPQEHGGFTVVALQNWGAPVTARREDKVLPCYQTVASPKKESLQMEVNFTILFVKKLQAEFINRHFYLKQENDKVASNNSRAHASNRNILTSFIC